MLGQKISRAQVKLLVLVLAFSLLGGAAPATVYAQGPVGNSDAPADCQNVRTLALNDSLTQGPLERRTAPEWIKFAVVEGARYRLQVQGDVGLQLGLYGGCSVTGPSVALTNGQLEFTATRSGELYLQLGQAGVPAGTAGYEVSLAPLAAYRPNSAPLAAVPTDLVRRATEFLEQLRGSNLAPEWKDARINPDARIFYRPDIQVAAYYDFTVERPISNTWQAAGFIELSTGEHDFVMTTWDSTGASPTAELEEIKPLGVRLTQFYRLDMQNYAAEYEQLTGIGIAVVVNDAVSLGGLPDKLDGLNGIPQEPFPLVTETYDTLGNQTYEGPTELPLITETPWATWNDLKAGYAASYDQLLQSLKQSASGEWNLDNNLERYGETLVTGDVRTVYGLAGQTVSGISVTGAGTDAKYLKQELLGTQAAPTGIKLTVLDGPADKTMLLPINVGMNYTSGTTETVKFAIANAAALKGLVYLPLVARSPAAASLADAGAAPGSSAPQGWGPWSYWWADGNAGAITYNQIPAHQRVNTSGCWSGCGATAWAMVFGWVDREAAAGNARWVNHWGLYRVNGGLGANAVAPNAQDAGVDNMTWEIRNHMGTFCSGTGGATYFTRMIDAINYVRPRATAAAVMRTRYDPTGLCWFGACNAARDLAREQIQYRRAPAIISVNDHYPLAYGYAEQSQRSCFLWFCHTDWNRWFYVNQGWGGSGNDWVRHDDVKFAGTYNNP